MKSAAIILLVAVLALGLGAGALPPWAKPGFTVAYHFEGSILGSAMDAVVTYSIVGLNATSRSAVVKVVFEGVYPEFLHSGETLLKIDDPYEMPPYPFLSPETMEKLEAMKPGDSIKIGLLNLTYVGVDYVETPAGRFKCYELAIYDKAHNIEAKRYYDTQLGILVKSESSMLTVELVSLHEPKWYENWLLVAHYACLALAAIFGAAAIITWFRERKR